MGYLWIQESWNSLLAFSGIKLPQRTQKKKTWALKWEKKEANPKDFFFFPNIASDLFCHLFGVISEKKLIFGDTLCCAICWSWLWCLSNQCLPFQQTFKIRSSIRHDNAISFQLVNMDSQFINEIRFLLICFFLVFVFPYLSNNNNNNNKKAVVLRILTNTLK